MTPLSTPGLGRQLQLLVWTALLAVLMLTPADYVPKLSAVDWSDKAGHALVFGVQCGLLGRWLAARPRRGGVLSLAVLGTGLYALVLEALQIWVPGRFWEWWDLVADAVGIAVAALLLGLARARLRRAT